MLNFLRFTFLLSILIGSYQVKSQSVTKPMLPSANSIKAKEYYNYSYRLLNYIQAKGKYSDFEELLKVAKKGLSFTKANDYKNLSGLQFITGMTYKIMVNNDSAFHYLQQSILNAQLGHDLDTEVSALQQINYLHRYLGQVEDTKKYINRLNNLHLKVKDIYLKDKIVSALSDDFLHNGAYTQAIDLLLGSLPTKEYIYRKKKDDKAKINLGLAFSELGSLYIQLNQNRNALAYLKKGQPYLDTYTGGRVRLFKKMQQCYLNLSMEDSAKVYYNNIYAIMQPGIYESAEDISGTNRLFAEYYLSKHNLAIASRYAKIAYAKGMVSGSNEAIMMAINMMGNLSYQQKKYQEAINYFKKALPNSDKFSKDVFASINLRLAQSYVQINNNKEATIFFNRYNLLRDNISAEKTKEGIYAIEFKYRNAQKEQQINLLNIQSAAQANELLQQKRYKNVLIISTLLVIIIAALIYRNYKNNKKINLLLDKKNQQLDYVNDQLNNANQTKTKLFSIISHDLRSPVSQLFTFLKLQQSGHGQLAEEVKQKQEQKLLQAATNVLTTMEDLLLWSKSQMENFELDVEEIDVQELLEESIALMQNQADAKNIKFELTDLKVKSLESDQNLLLIVLRNLLQNAINNTYPNTVIFLDTGLNNQNKPFLSIKNQGDVMEKYQIEALLSNQYIKSKSSGYGLIIVKELLQKINASLQIESSTAHTLITVVLN